MSEQKNERKNSSGVRMAVFGDPIAHTLSPALHGILIRHYQQNMSRQISDEMFPMTYEARLVHSEELSVQIQKAYEEGIRGINLTVPHKSAVLPYLCAVKEEARILGAVNTLTWTPEGYVGENTDGYGFCRLLEKNGMELVHKNVLILGAGGAARSVLYQAIQQQALSVTIWNRTKSRAQSLAAEFSRITSIPIHVIEDRQFGEKSYDLCIQATSKGLPSNPGLPVECPELYRSIHEAVDLVYRPFRTDFLRAAEKGGARCAGGLTMLFYQGVRSFEIWNKFHFSEIETSLMEKEFALCLSDGC